MFNLNDGLLVMSLTSEYQQVKRESNEYLTPLYLEMYFQYANINTPKVTVSKNADER